MKFGGKTWIRWPIGAFAAFLSFRMIAKLFQTGGGTSSIGVLLVSMSLLIVAAVCFAPEAAKAVSAPLFRWIDGIYLPGGRPERAPLSFRLSDYYEKTRQYDLAVAEYRRILEDYPDEPKAYAGLVRLLASDMDDPKSARRWLKRGLRRVPAPQRPVLRKQFLELC